MWCSSTVALWTKVWISDMKTKNVFLISLFLHHFLLDVKSLTHPSHLLRSCHSPPHSRSRANIRALYEGWTQGLIVLPPFWDYEKSFYSPQYLLISHTVEQLNCYQTCRMCFSFDMNLWIGSSVKCYSTAAPLLAIKKNTRVGKNLSTHYKLYSG